MFHRFILKYFRVSAGTRLSLIGYWTKPGEIASIHPAYFKSSLDSRGWHCLSIELSFFIFIRKPFHYNLYLLILRKLIKCLFHGRILFFTVLKQVIITTEESSTWSDRTGIALYARGGYPWKKTICDQQPLTQENNIRNQILLKKYL